MKSLLIEGWHFIPHSYAMVNQYQCLELMHRPGISLFHRHLPYLLSHWSAGPMIWDSQREQQLRSLKAPPAGLRPDVLLRIGFPLDFHADPAAGRTFVWATTELKMVAPDAMAGGLPVAATLMNLKSTIITCSNWAAAGFIASGADPQRVQVVSCGVDTSIFHPLTPSKRAELRAANGWDGKFVVLNVSAMSGNKGIGLLLQAGAALADEAPELRITLKGADGLYPSQAGAAHAFDCLRPDEKARLAGRVNYVGATLTNGDLATLYQAADAYVTPYQCEGFNIPALEALACGLPVIATAGGSTDDFLPPDAALRVHSTEQVLPNGGHWLNADLPHLIAQLRYVHANAGFRAHVAEVGPRWVQQGYTWKDSVDRLLGVLYE